MGGKYVEVFDIKSSKTDTCPLLKYILTKYGHNEKEFLLLNLNE